MSVIKEKYSDKKVNLIHQMLLGEQETGTPKDYDIRVDDLKVVSRTNDPERFFDHEDFIQEDTKNVTICLYDGSSRKCTRYMLLMKDEEPAGQQAALAGIEKSFDDKIAQERSKWDYDKLKEDYDQLKETYNEYKELNSLLETKLQKVREENEKYKSSNKLTDALIGIAEVYVANNPQALNGIPFIGGLLGGGTRDKTDKENEQGREDKDNGAKATYTEKEEATPEPELKYTGNPTNDDSRRFCYALVPLFPSECRKKVFDINIAMSMHNELIDQIHGLLPEQPKDQAKQPA